MNRLEKCPYCDGKLIEQATTEKLKYRGKTLLIDMIGEYCPICIEGFQSPKDLKINEHNIELAKVKADQIIAKDIARIRKKLKLTQTQASEIFGGGIRAFYKYENGLTNPPQTLVLLLDLLDQEKITLDEVLENQEEAIA